MKGICVLGATGSIGISTLDVVGRHPELYRVVALTANRDAERLAEQCRRHRPALAVLADVGAAERLRGLLADMAGAPEVLTGPEALAQVAALPEVDIVMAAIVGAAGLLPTLAAARTGKRLLLANKEALVVAGEILMSAAAASGALLLPIDSEHNAIFQCMPAGYEHGLDQVGVERILLTASGGPFRDRPLAELERVTPDQACAHPNWRMGRKISVDSATMMNKALEVIEARYLFGVSPDQLDVVIHPQSIVHSMVQYKDHSLVSQMGTPDMRGPIAYGLSWPERITSGAAALDFHALPAMTFEAIDAPGHTERFPGLPLAWAALRGPAGSCAVLNASNEIGVAAFLERRIRFDQIHRTNLETLEAVTCSNPQSLDDLLDLDARSRIAAESVVSRLAR